MIDLKQYIDSIDLILLQNSTLQPWEVLEHLERILAAHIATLGNDYVIENNIAIHKTATIEEGVTLKGTIIISENCFVGAHAYLRGAIFLSNSVTIGPSSEIKQSIIADHSAVAHFNFIGNSILGQYVNFEAGSLCANHYNERQDKRIMVKHKNQMIDTKTEKFGALVGDHSKIGANAVLSPGTILEPFSVVKRLELVEQVK
ncbi:DapH/DapD/GlmU-related protein [Sphingobacterium chungjuense]|uniref:DapH/DapD/GlmU-related protein n=1 Tax=Sphingobacterium chungjuense TaxID=2675553 RepID=UPI0014082FA3|nr:LpxA family transferase [Sphingobacterium chungjuense]